MGNWCKYRKYKCWLYLGVNVLNRKIGVELRSESIARRAGWWWMGRVQKIRMFKCTPHRPKINTYFWIFVDKWYLQDIYFLNNIGKIIRRTSKSVYDCKEKNNLLFWNMNTHKTRKVICEKVQVNATVIVCKLWTSQGTMCWTEIYNTLQ